MSIVRPATRVVRVMSHPDGRSGIIVGVVMGFLAAFTVCRESILRGMVRAVVRAELLDVEQQTSESHDE